MIVSTCAELAGRGIRTDPNVVGGVRLWRQHDRLALTVVVKVSFAMAPDHVVAVAPPSEIAREDRQFDDNPARSLETASELAPFLARCDVLFTGHAHAHAKAIASTVRLAIYRDAQPLLDKTVHVFGDGTGAERVPFTKMPLVYERASGGAGVDANPLGTDRPNLLDPRDATRPACFGPVSPYWPARKRLLTPLTRRELDAPIAPIPAQMSWDYFQAAPRDQQIEYLRGGEWIVLDGLNAARPRIQTQLSKARAVALLCPRVPGPARPIDLVADMLVIDGDRERCSIVWRGRHEVASEAALAQSFIAVALALPGRPVDWTALAAQTGGSSEVRDLEDEDPESTIPLRPDVQSHAVVPVVPFSPRPLPEANRPLGVTGTPWADAPLASPPAPVDGEATMRVGAIPDASRSEDTLTVQADRAARDRPVAPFAVAPPRAHERAGESSGASATPWGPAPVVRAPEVIPGEGTLSLGQAKPTQETRPPKTAPSPHFPGAPTAPEPRKAPPALATKPLDAVAPKPGPPGGNPKGVAALLSALEPPKRPPDEDDDD